MSAPAPTAPQHTTQGIAGYPESPAAPPDRRRRGRRWIDDWRPEDPRFWQDEGWCIARRNLVLSIVAEHVGFSIWSIWSVFVLFLTPEYGLSHDPKTAAAQKFVLTMLPTAIGAAARLPYTFAVATFGGRNWTIISAVLLIAPCLAAAIALQPGSSYSTLLIAAAIAGVGGGNFASSMANINAFYPQRLKGRALGLNAGGGNLGVAAVQLVGLAVLAIFGKEHPRYLIAFYLPLVVLAALGAALYMDNIAGMRNEKGALRDAARRRQTWIVSLLYIGTFGSFIGFGFAFGQVLQNQFGAQFMTHGAIDPVKIAGLTFLGPLIGSLIRPVGGWLADRFGGARTTMANFVAMAVAAALVLGASRQNSLALFYVGFLALFVFSGIGNGSTYKMIPSIFGYECTRAIAAGGDPDRAAREAQRLSGAVIGIAGAIGAFGGVLVNIAFRQSFLQYRTGDRAYLIFIAYYVLCGIVTWCCYLRTAQLRARGI